MFARNSHFRALRLLALLVVGVGNNGCKFAKERREKSIAPAAEESKLSLTQESFSMESKILGEKRAVNVYLPPQYASEAQRRFAVLYMPDGGLQEDFPHIAQTIDQLIEQGEVEPMLVVGVANIDRRKDLTTLTGVPKEQEKVPQAGGSTAFRDFFQTELKAEIARRYRVADMPTAIVGESLAGRWIVEGWLRSPDSYDTWIAIDPSLWWNDGELLKLAAHDLPNKKTEIRSRIYLNGAYREKKGNLPAVKLLVDAIKNAGISAQLWSFESYPEYEHQEIFKATKTRIFQRMLSSLGQQSGN